jgi:hypothetical protein
VTSAVKVDCPNARVVHFATRERANAEMLDRKIKDACRGKRGKPVVRHVEPCEPCGEWMIVSSEQRERRPGRR